MPGTFLAQILPRSVVTRTWVVKTTTPSPLSCHQAGSRRAVYHTLPLPRSFPTSSPVKMPPDINGLLWGAFPISNPRSLPMVPRFSLGEIHFFPSSSALARADRGTPLHLPGRRDRGLRSTRARTGGLSGQARRRVRLLQGNCWGCRRIQGREEAP